jgi:hypothetical protein
MAVTFLSWVWIIQLEQAKEVRSRQIKRQKKSLMSRPPGFSFAV